MAEGPDAECCRVADRSNDYWSSTFGDVPWTVGFQDGSTAHTVNAAFAHCVL